MRYWLGNETGVLIGVGRVPNWRWMCQFPPVLTGMDGALLERLKPRNQTEIAVQSCHVGAVERDVAWLMRDSDQDGLKLVTFRLASCWELVLVCPFPCPALTFWANRSHQSRTRVEIATAAISAGLKSAAAPACFRDFCSISSILHLASRSHREAQLHRCSIAPSPSVHPLDRSNSTQPRPRLRRRAILATAIHTPPSALPGCIALELYILLLLTLLLTSPARVMDS
jgi:hypothetical protein